MPDIAEATPTESVGLDQNHELFKRQLGFYDPSEHQADHVSIIGLGGIGSFATFGIAKLGVPNITIVDDDHVELHNIPNQFHAVDQIGTSKAEAMVTTISAYAPCDGLDWHVDRITSDGMAEWNPRGLVLSGVDSMTSRLDIWENGQIKFNPRVSHYIDARIAGQLLVVYSLDPNNLDDVKSYEKTLHTDGEALPAPCTERGVIDVGLMAGAVLTNMVRHALTGGEVASVTSINLAHPPVSSGDWIL